MDLTGALPSGGPSPLHDVGQVHSLPGRADQHAQQEAQALEEGNTVLEQPREAMRTRWHSGGPLEKGKDYYAPGFCGLPDLATGALTA